jgi:ribose-phosphate pyrophosphokinase
MAIKLFSGNSNVVLANEISEMLSIPLGDATVSSFKDGEIRVKINENIRGGDVFIVQSTNPPDSNIMELLILVDACRRASASRITAVVPYFGYARQDRKDQPRVPITAKLMANLLTVAGCSRVLTMDLHADQIQGFFDIPLDHLFASPLIIDYFIEKELDNLVIVAPDLGSVKRARVFSKKLKSPIAIIDKRREEANVSDVMNIVGEVEGKNVIIPDDMLDTGGTIVNASIVLKERGAREIFCSCTHALFSGSANKNIEESPITEMVVANTIYHPERFFSDKVKTVSVASLLSEAIRRIHNNESVSSLFM